MNDVGGLQSNGGEVPVDDPQPTSTDEGSIAFRLKELTFSDGTSLQVPTSGAVVIVGPNNAGKSASLRDIISHVQTGLEGRSRPNVVTQLSVEIQGSEENLRDWLNHHAFLINRADGVYFQRPQANVRWDQVRGEWTGATSQAIGPYRLTGLGPLLMFHAAADQRLGLLSESGPYNPQTEGPSDPHQTLFARPDLEIALADTAYEAFGKRVVLSRIWGDNLRLHMGSTDIPASLPPSREYMQALEALPLARDQGDGIRSFLGLMLALTASSFPIVLVDEPEAFLHPPQARLIGRKLITDAPGATQVIIATHDSDVLNGVLDSPNSDVTVVRLTRDDEQNSVSVLSPQDLREIWRDPLLRYSNILEGLFHNGVVISESDADSRYYSAVLDAAYERNEEAPLDLLFTQSGGKQRLPTVLRALRGLEIPVAVVADFDVLREEPLLSDLVALLGGEWAEFRTDWVSVTAGVEQLGSAPPIEAVRAEITGALDENEGPMLSRESADRIRAATRIDDSWRKAKGGGLGVLPQGEASRRGAHLLETLKAIGLFVVPVGELERWEPDLGGHGPAWVASAVEARRHEVEGSATNRFVDEIVEGFVRASDAR